MTASQLLIMAGVLLLAHEITPKTRAILGLAIGLWGVVLAAFAMFF